MIWLLSSVVISVLAWECRVLIVIVPGGVISGLYIGSDQEDGFMFWSLN